VVTVPLFVGAVAVYSMSYLLTVLARSGEKAINYGMGIVLISLFLPVVEEYWHLPSSSFVAFMFAGCEWVTAPIKTFPFGELIFYLVLALAFPAAAQLILERREV
jgi:hypothetical protein